MRAAAALKVPVSTLFTPMIAVQAIGLAFVFTAAWGLGGREERRLAVGLVPTGAVVGTAHVEAETEAHDAALRRPRLLWLNAALTLVVVGTMIAGIAEPVVIFMLGTALALIVNYPDAAEQRRRIDAHARAALMMAGILLAAGAFTGIMTGSGMLGAIATTTASHIPASLGAHLPVIVGVASMPLSLLFDPDSCDLGALPELAHVSDAFGTPGVAVARAALLGQMTTGFPVSPLTPATFLVAGLSGVDLGAHQRFSIPWLLAASLVMVAAALLLGAIPL